MAKISVLSKNLYYIFKNFFVKITVPLGLFGFLVVKKMSVSRLLIHKKLSIFDNYFALLKTVCTVV